MASNYVKCLIQRFLLKFKYIVNTQRESLNVCAVSIQNIITFPG